MTHTDLESASGGAAERTLEQVFEYWQGHMGTRAVGVQPIFVARDSVHMLPEVHETCLIKVVQLYSGCRIAKKLLSVAPDSCIMQRALKFWKAELGAGLAVACRHIQAPSDGTKSAATRKTHITDGIPAATLVRFLRATKYLRQVRDLFGLRPPGDTRSCNHATRSHNISLTSFPS